MSDPNLPIPQQDWIGQPELVPSMTSDPMRTGISQMTPHRAIINSMDATVRPFQFDGGAGSYLGVSILALLLTTFTLGIAYPWALCMSYRWRSQHTLVYGRRVRFTGSGGGLFGQWIKWFLLTLITVGIYSFWVVPRLQKWITEHQEFELR